MAIVLVAGGCSSDDGDTILVGAASSLSDVMPALADDYRQGGGAQDVSFAFSGSQLLAAQAIERAPFDLLITADEGTMNRVAERGALGGPVVRLAGNRMTVAVTAGNPLGIDGPADLVNRDLIVALADVEVPAGRYTARALELAGLDLAPTSREPSVRAVLARLQQGEADAGIVYETDIRAAIDVEAVPGLPVVMADYFIARVTDTATVKRFETYLLSDRAASVFADYGFTP